MHECGPLVGVRRLSELRASHTRPKTAVDCGFSFTLWNSESSRNIEEHGFHVAARQCLGSHESRESKRSKVQSRIALTDRCHEELTLLRSKRRRGVALVLPARLAD